MVSSSRPSWPWTSSTCSAPWACEHGQHPLGHRDGSATPRSIRRTRAGLASGPRMLKAVGMPISRRDGPAWRRAGWNRGARQKPIPASSTQRATAAGDSSIATPRASSRSAAPHARTRPGCRACTPGTPAPATTSAARVDTLMLWLRSPTGADDVDGPVRPAPSGSGHQVGRGQHGVEHPAQLVDGLALHPQGDDEGRRTGPGWPARRASRPWPRVPCRQGDPARRPAAGGPRASRRGRPAGSSRSGARAGFRPSGGAGG